MSKNDVAALDALIEKLEKLTEPDPYVDCDIARFLGEYDEPGLSLSVRGYTSSIDSALTLVPEGFKWKCGYSRFVPHVAELRDYRDKPILGTFIGECDSNRAIALCIASLRARKEIQ